MSRWNASDLPDMTGRTVVVTGASAGLGLVTATELARVGAAVVLAVRSVTKGEQAAAQIPGRTEVRELDVSDLASVRRFAAGWTGDIDVLIDLPRVYRTRSFALLCRCSVAGMGFAGGLVAQAGVQPRRVVPAVDVPGDVADRVRTGRVDGAVDTLVLEGREEGLGHRVIVTDPGPPG